MANAVCSCGESPSRALHRARTIEPSDGIDAPATAPDSSSAHSGARITAQPMKMIVLSAKNPASGLSTRCWPNRSASLAACGAPTASPIEPAAATVPARPYLPVIAAISSTVPSPNIAIGMRARSPAAEKPSAPGYRKISRYGLPRVRACCRSPRTEWASRLAIPAVATANPVTVTTATPVSLLTAPVIVELAMTGLLRRTALRSTAAVTPALRSVAVAGLVLALAAGAYPARNHAVRPPVGGGAAPARSAPGRGVPTRTGEAGATADGASAAAAFGRIILPDLLVVEPTGLTAARVARIGKITGVRNVLGFDGGEIRSEEHT